MRLPYEGCNTRGVALSLAVEHLRCRVERRGAIEDDVFVELIPGHGGRYTVTSLLAGGVVWLCEASFLG